MPGKGTIRPYYLGDWICAVFLSAAVGFCAVLGLELSTLVLTDIDNVFTDPTRLFGHFVVGLPAAILFCWLFLSPPLYWLMRSPINASRATRLGFGISTFVSLTVFGYQRFLSWLKSQDGIVFDLPPNPYRIENDGILTPFSWLTASFDFIVFCSICTLGAVLIQRILGPGERSCEKEFSQ